MTFKAPRYSVLMPTHNRADVLGLAIASVLAQTEPDFELLIVADGCTDDTANVVSTFKDPRIRFFDLPKAPYFGYANRNVALREARGRLIAFAAHDDLLLSDHLALMAELLEKSGAAWGYSRPLWVSMDGIIVPFCANLGVSEEMKSFHEHGNVLPAPCIVHTREVLERVGYWPEDVPNAADWVLWRRMLSVNANHFAYQPHPTTFHFSANWKQSRHAQFGAVKTLLEIADGVSWWPAIFCNPPGSAETEQAALWRAMQSGGDKWIGSLRAAVDTVVNRVAWTTVLEILPRLIATNEKLADTERALSVLKIQLDEVHASGGWRIARLPLRVKKWFLKYP